MLLASRIYQRLCQALWAAGVLFLPISSLPILVNLAHASSVGPPTTAFLSLLAIAWLLPYIWRGGRLPAETALFLLFVGAALFTWALAFYRNVPPLQDKTLLGEARSTFVTLAMGLAVFFTAAGWLRSQENAMRTTLRLIHISSLPLFTWSLVQAYFILFKQSLYPDFIYQVQYLLSSSHLSLYPGRVTGMAFEPSFLAHQLNTVYLPIWLASSTANISVFRRLGKLSVENILLVAGTLVMILTFSRVGWISYGLYLGILGLQFISWAAGKVETRLFANRTVSVNSAVRVSLMTGLTFGFALLTGLILVGLYAVGMQFDNRLVLILQRNPLAANNFYDFANRLFIGERVVYWSVGLEIFNAFPWFGVGLGNAGFYFPARLPAFAFGLVEVQNLLYRLGVGFNIKSLWVRVLAETGLLGFSMFLSWYAALARAGQAARRSADPLVRLIGMTGLFMLTGFIAEGFSIDSFALPYFWFTVGLLVAAASLSRAETTPV